MRTMCAGPRGLLLAASLLAATAGCSLAGEDVDPQALAGSEPGHSLDEAVAVTGVSLPAGAREARYGFGDGAVALRFQVPCPQVDDALAGLHFERPLRGRGQPWSPEVLGLLDDYDHLWNGNAVRISSSARMQEVDGQLTVGPSAGVLEEPDGCTVFWIGNV